MSVDNGARLLATDPVEAYWQAANHAARLAARVAELEQTLAESREELEEAIGLVRDMAGICDTIDENTRSMRLLTHERHVKTVWRRRQWPDVPDAWKAFVSSLTPAPSEPQDSNARPHGGEGGGMSKWTGFVGLPDGYEDEKMAGMTPIERLRAMTEDKGGTWDLSPKDVAAILWALSRIKQLETDAARVAELERERDAAKLALDRCKFALTKVCYLDPDGPEEGGWDEAIEFLSRPAPVAQANDMSWRGWAEAVNKAFGADLTPAPSEPQP
jgi:hypothetical protein